MNIYSRVLEFAGGCLYTGSRIRWRGSLQNQTRDEEGERLRRSERPILEGLQDRGFRGLGFRGYE